MLWPLLLSASGLVAKPVLVSIAIIAAGAMLCWLVPWFYCAVEAGLRTSTQARVTTGELCNDNEEATVQERLDGLIQVGLLLATFGMVMAAGCKKITPPDAVKPRNRIRIEDPPHLSFLFFSFFSFPTLHSSLQPTRAADAGSSYLLGAFAAGMAFSQLEHPDRPGESRYGNFDIVFDHFSRISEPYTTPHGARVGCAQSNADAPVLK